VLPAIGKTFRLTGDTEADERDEFMDYYRACLTIGTDGNTTLDAAACKTKTKAKIAAAPGSKPNVAVIQAYGAAAAFNTLTECTKTKFQAVSGPESGKQAEAFDACAVEARSDAVAALGASAKDAVVNTKLAVIMEISEREMECLEGGSDKAACDAHGKTAYSAMYGAAPIKNGAAPGVVDPELAAMIEAEWTQDKSGIQDLALARFAGTSMMLVKQKRAVVDVEFAVASSSIDQAATEAAIKKAILAASPAAKVTSCSKYAKTAAKSSMKCYVEMPSSTDIEIETFSSTVSAVNISGVTTRRADHAGVTTAGQSSTQCPTSGCGTGETAFSNVWKSSTSSAALGSRTGWFAVLVPFALSALKWVM